MMCDFSLLDCCGVYCAFLEYADITAKFVCVDGRQPLVNLNVFCRAKYYSLATGLLLGDNEGKGTGIASYTTGVKNVKPIIASVP